MNPLIPSLIYDKFDLPSYPSVLTLVLSFPIGIRRYDIYDVANGHPFPVSFFRPPRALSSPLNHLLRSRFCLLSNSPSIIPASISSPAPLLPRYFQRPRELSPSRPSTDSPSFPLPSRRLQILFFFSFLKERSRPNLGYRGYREPRSIHRELIRFEAQRGTRAMKRIPRSNSHRCFPSAIE